MTLPDWWPSDKNYIIDDCLNVMKTIPDDCIELVIADPPYGFGKSNLQWEEKGYSRISEDWDKEAPVEWINEAYRILKEGGTLLCFSGYKSISKFINNMNQFELRNIIVWDKINTMPNITKRGYQFSHEFIIWLTKKDKYTFNINEQIRDILRFTWSEGNNKRVHPAQKPESLLVDLIQRHSNTSDIVFDPFLGSGTTLLACRKTNRTGLGCELSPEYQSIIANRSMQNIKRITDF